MSQKLNLQTPITFNYKPLTRSNRHFSVRDAEDELSRFLKGAYQSLDITHEH